MKIRRKGVPVVVSAPSGAGKTTLCRRAMTLIGGVNFSVSHTTRPPRPGEVDGRDYHFVDDATFSRLVDEDVFLEWAHVYGQRYGTSRAGVEAQLQTGVDVFFDIDVQGGRQIAQRLDDAVLVFVMPPSFASLEMRLRQRASDSAQQVERRLAAAMQEIEQARLYTHIIVNDDLETAAADLVAIVRAERIARIDVDDLIAQIVASKTGP